MILAGCPKTDINKVTNSTTTININNNENHTDNKDKITIISVVKLWFASLFIFNFERALHYCQNIGNLNTTPIITTLSARTQTVNKIAQYSWLILSICFIAISLFTFFADSNVTYFTGVINYIYEYIWVIAIAFLCEYVSVIAWNIFVPAAN